MPLTPWGETAELRERGASSTRQLPRERVREEQRRRLLAAMVACCEEQGYEASSVADLLRVSGLSRATFYTHFDDKLACFVAAVEETFSLGIEAISQRVAEGESPEARARSAIEAFVDVVAAQPAAARMCLVEAYGVGEAGAEPVRRAVDTVGRLAHQLLQQMPGGEQMPVELARALVDGIHRVIYGRLQSRRASELPELVGPLWRWATSYPAPIEPLRQRRRRARETSPDSVPPFALWDPEQRILRGLAAVAAERGYARATIADVAAQASVSQATFYEYFDGKADAMQAALDSSGAQMTAAALPPARRAQDWPAAIRTAVAASCGFLAAEPAFARLREVEVYAAGPEAIAVRNRSGAELLAALLESSEEIPTISGIVAEAILGAIYGTFYRRIWAGETASLPDSAPLLTYLVLAPLLGAEEACRVANGSGRSSRPTTTR